MEIHQTGLSSSSPSSSSSYICHGVGPLVDPFRSHVSRSLFKGLPRFLLPVGLLCFITLGNLFLGHSIYMLKNSRLKKTCPASFRETCQWLKCPLNGLRAQSRVRSVVGLLHLASGPACSGMAFPPFLVKQLYRCDSVVISSFVRTGYATRR